MTPDELMSQTTSLDFSPGVVVVELGGGMDAWVGFCGSGHGRVVPCRRVVRAFPGPVGLSWSVGQVVERLIEGAADALPGGRDRGGPPPGGIDTQT